MRKLQTEGYLTPAGFHDFPFTYVYDATGLTDGTAQIISIQKPLQGDCDFVLRAIVGVPTVVDTGANGGRFNFRNASGSYAVASPIVLPNVYTVVPEKLYPYNASITFDLYQILRQSTACGGNPIPTSYIAFQGVKRFPITDSWQERVTPYRYREFRYSYEYQMTLTVGRFATVGGNEVTPVQRQVIPLDNFDFELLQIGISSATGGARGGGIGGALTTPDFALTLYDANMHQLSDLPLMQGYVNSARPTPAGAPPYQGIIPVPSLVYPAGGNLVIDVTSYLCANAVPQTYNISFEGIWRKPCQ